MTTTPEASPASAPRPVGHYSPVVEAAGLLFVSGQLPTRGDGLDEAEASFGRQVEQALGKLASVLEDAGSSLHRVVRVTAYIADIQHWDEFDAVYRQVMRDHRPARTVVPVSPLHHGFLVEIDAIAAVGGGRPATGI